MGINIKRYPMCYATHRSIDAVLNLAAEHKAAKMYLRFAEKPRPQPAIAPSIVEEIPDDWPVDDDGPTYMP